MPCRQGRQCARRVLLVFPVSRYCRVLHQQLHFGCNHCLLLPPFLFGHRLLVPSLLPSFHRWLTTILRIRQPQHEMELNEETGDRLHERLGALYLPSPVRNGRTQTKHSYESMQLANWSL